MARRKNTSVLKVVGLATAVTAAVTFGGLAHERGEDMKRERAAAAEALRARMTSQGTLVHLGDLAADCVSVRLPGLQLDDAERAVLSPAQQGPGGTSRADIGERRTGAHAAAIGYLRSAKTVRLAIGGADTPPASTEAQVCALGSGSFEVTMPSAPGLADDDLLIQTVE